MRKILLGLLVVVVVFSAWVSFKSVAPLWSVPDRPTSLDRVGVVVRSIEVKRRSVLTGLGLGSVTDLHPRGFGGDGCPLIVGENAALWTESEGCVQRRVDFPSRATHVDAVQWAGDAGPEFLSRGQWCCEPFLLDGSGQVLWSFERGDREAVNDTVIIRGASSERDLVLTFNGGGGVLRIAADGREHWHQEDGNVWHAATLDVDGDGLEEIVHSNACGSLVVREADGAVRSSARPEGYFSKFELLRFGGAPVALHVDDGRILLVGMDGSTQRAFDAPLAFSLGEPRGTFVEVGKQRWLVTLISGSHFDRSALSVHDATGRLVYAEVLQGGCDAISEAGPSTVWFGCPDRVVELSLGTAPIAAVRAN